MSEHQVSIKTYVATFVALIALTILTTAVAFVDMGELNTVVALAIAFLKMSLVVLFFMHLKYQKGMTRAVIVAGFFWMAILVTLTLADELTRHWTPVSGSWSAILPYLRGIF